MNELICKNCFETYNEYYEDENGTVRKANKEFCPTCIENQKTLYNYETGNIRIKQTTKEEKESKKEFERLYKAAERQGEIGLKEEIRKWEVEKLTQELL